MPLDESTSYSTPPGNIQVHVTIPVDPTEAMMAINFSRKGEYWSYESTYNSRAIAALLDGITRDPKLLWDFVKYPPQKVEVTDARVIATYTLGTGRNVCAIDIHMTPRVYDWEREDVITSALTMDSREDEKSSHIDELAKQDALDQFVALFTDMQGRITKLEKTIVAIRTEWLAIRTDIAKLTTKKDE